MNDFESKGPAQPASPDASSATAAVPGRSTLQQFGEGLADAANPVGMGVRAGRYVGSVFANHNNAAQAGAHGPPQAPPNQQAQPQGAAGGANAVAITAPPGSPAHRVQTAAATGDIAAVQAIQTELLAQQPRTPEINDGLSAARSWMMDRIVAIRAQFRGEIQSARTTSAAATQGRGHHIQPGQGISVVEQAEARMAAQCDPYLAALMAGDPQHRYEYHGSGEPRTVTEEVFAAVRLRAVNRALDGIGHAGHRAAAEAEARREGNVHGDAAWCGAFAFTQQHLAGGLDTIWRSNMAGVPGIRGALLYHSPTKWIWTGTEWQDLQTYHNARHSPRRYATIERTAPEFGIEPGDIVLIDNKMGLDADHVTTAISFDGHYLTLVGGNQGSNRANDEQGVSRSRDAFDLSQNPPRNNVTGQLDAQGRQIGKESRVHSVGRWSIVDYEQHTYSTLDTMPTGAPDASSVGGGGHGGGGHSHGGGGHGGGGGPAPAGGGH